MNLLLCVLGNTPKLGKQLAMVTLQRRYPCVRFILKIWDQKMFEKRKLSTAYTVIRHSSHWTVTSNFNITSPFYSQYKHSVLISHSEHQVSCTHRHQLLYTDYLEADAQVGQ